MNPTRIFACKILSATVCATITITVSGTVMPSLAKNGKTGHRPIFKSSGLPTESVAMIKRKERDGRRWITARVIVNAPRQKVWQCIKDQRLRDPDLDYSKVIARDENSSTVEEKLQLPFIGSEVCQILVRLNPMKQIDYRLIKAKRFKSYEGSWKVSKSSSSKSTILTLDHHMEMNFFVPHWVMDRLVARRVAKRVLGVKQIAEQHDKKTREDKDKSSGSQSKNDPTRKKQPGAEPEQGINR